MFMVLSSKPLREFTRLHTEMVYPSTAGHPSWY